MNNATVSEDSVREALRQVNDPEVGMNIVDLGLVYRIDVEPRRICVDLTMTTAACPLGELITGEAHHAVAGVAPEGVAVEVRLVWDPPWNPGMMSETARQTFGWSG